MTPLLEICAFNLHSALIASAYGADRIELCSDYAAGGITPTYETVEKAMRIVKIPINVMIRPRGGDFVYSSKEWLLILEDIKRIKKMGVNGFVVGCLNANGTIDIQKIIMLKDLVGNAELVFHRAFDQCQEPYQAIDQLIDVGIDRILTSGGKENALTGKDKLKSYIEHAHGKIEIMPGGGVRSSNSLEILTTTNATAIHSSAIKSNHSHESSFNADPKEIMALKNVLHTLEH